MNCRRLFTHVCASAGSLFGVELARAEHHLLLLAVDVVAVDVDVEEVEQRADRLDLAESRRAAAPDPRGARCRWCPGCPRSLRGGLLARRELLLIDLVEPVGVARHLDVAREVWLLPRDLVRLDDEVLDDRRVDGAGDCYDDPDAERRDRQEKAGTKHADDDEHGDDRRDRHLHVEDRQIRVDVGVERADDPRPAWSRRARTC